MLYHIASTNKIDVLEIDDGHLDAMCTLWNISHNYMDSFRVLVIKKI